MKILVCIKQVADAESRFHIAPGGSRILFDPGAVYRMNRYDEFALEEALRVKDAAPDTLVHAVSLGPPRAESTLRRALEMGAHDAFRIEGDDEGVMPALWKARMIAAWAVTCGYDLVLAGVMSEDSMSCQFAPALAEYMGAASATGVMEIAIAPAGGRVTVGREIDSNTREIVELSLPAVLAVQSGINRPRYPSLSNVLRAKERMITTVRSDTPAGPDQDIRYHEAPRGREGRILAGSPAEKAAALCDFFHEVSLL